MQEYLLFSLLGLTAIVLFSNIVGSNTSENVTNMVSIILSSLVMILSVVMVSKYGLTGNHGKAWVLFMLFSAYWFCAEFVDFFYEFVLEIQPWEYADDFFYITGYQLFFASLLFYLRPFVRQISKKILVGASIIGIGIMIPSIMIILQNHDSLNENFFILLSYPILDSLLIIPALIGVSLFFRGQVNFLVSLIFLGIISHTIGDNSILFLSIQDAYYPGHLAETLFLWTYTMLAFGLWNQIRLFVEKSEKDIFT